MFAEIIEYDNALDKIAEKGLSESQVDTLIKIIVENPTITVPKLLEITDQLADNEHIILDSGTYSIDPIMNESEEVVNLMEIAIPVITKHIPQEIIGYMTEVQARAIVDKILDVEFDETTTRKELTDRIDEMFEFGNISFPIGGLRRRPENAQVVLAGTFTQMLHKGIQFSKEQYEQPKRSQEDNKYTLRNAMREFKMLKGDEDSPLMKILPKLIMKLKNLVGSMNKC